MDRAPRHRFQFGSRALLICVSAAAVTLAIYRYWPEREVLPGLRLGTPQDVVLQQFGEPGKTIESGDGWAPWVYYVSESKITDGITISYGGGDDRWRKKFKGQSLTIEFLDGRVTGGRID